MSLISKVALGTVQFGLDYGINNSEGQVDKSAVRSILNYCAEVGIDTLDTAHAYGNSEVVLGENELKDFKVISKLPNCDHQDIEDLFVESLSRLGVSRLYAYMLHNFSIYKENKEIWNQLVALKESGRVKKIGVSLYSPSELLELLEDGIELDIVQIPYNLFDRRFEQYFPLLKEQNIELHSRSTFLQGLFFRSLEYLPAHFDAVRDKLKYIVDIANTREVSISSLCLSFSLQNRFIDKVVIGVDSLDQLKGNVIGMQNQSSEYFIYSNLRVNDLKILNPSNWKI